MPVVLKYKSYQFFFYSNEGDPKEPLHIHVRKNDALAKIWLEPDPHVTESYGFGSHELNELLQIAIKNQRMIARYWNDHFSY